MLITFNVWKVDLKSKFLVWWLSYGCRKKYLDIFHVLEFALIFFLTKSEHIIKVVCLYRFLNVFGKLILQYSILMPNSDCIKILYR